MGIWCGWNYYQLENNFIKNELIYNLILSLKCIIKGNIWISLQIDFYDIFKNWINFILRIYFYPYLIKID